MQNEIIRAIYVKKSLLYNTQVGMFFHKIGDEIYMGILSEKMDSLLYNVTKWVSVNSDGIINIDKKYGKKTLQDIILECKSIRVIPAIYLLKKS